MSVTATGSAMPTEIIELGQIYRGFIALQLATRRLAPEGGSRRRRGLCWSGQLLADCAFNLAALHPAYPIKRQPSAERT